MYKILRKQLPPDPPFVHSMPLHVEDSAEGLDYVLEGGKDDTLEQQPLVQPSSTDSYKNSSELEDSQPTTSAKEPEQDSTTSHRYVQEVRRYTWQFCGA